MKEYFTATDFPRRQSKTDCPGESRKENPFLKIRSAPFNPFSRFLRWTLPYFLLGTYQLRKLATISEVYNSTLEKVDMSK